MDPPWTRINQERMKAYSNAAEKALNAIRSHLDAKQQELAEYTNLIHCLEELPKKRTHTIMSPIGSVGFLDATIVHSNEILVGLGDGYFLETTAYGATEILKRRKTVIEHNILDLRQHENLIIQQKSFADQLFDNRMNTNEVEIREDYDEAKENELRKKRRSRRIAPRILTKTVADINAEAEIMKRLEELELQELRNGEIDHCTDNKGGPFVYKLMNLNGDDTKCLTSMMTLHATKDDFSQSSVVQFPTNSIEFPNTCKNQETPTSSTQVESFVATTKENLTENEVYEDDVRHDFSTDAFHGEELVEMLTNQEEDYDENVHAYKPPRGINVEDYQKLLRVIESINSEGSDSDRISEESNESYKEVEQMDEEGSELDSDDITDAEFQNKDYIPSPFVEKVKSNITVANVNDRIEVKGECDNLSAKVSQNEEKLKRNPMRKKKKAVVFAENLEDATLIDKNAPPCDVRASTACTSKTQPKKILTNCDEKSPVDEQAVMNVRSEKANCSYAFRDTSTAFTGVFQEKNLDYLASDCDQTIVTEPVKRQSLFKIKSRSNL